MKGVKRMAVMTKVKKNFVSPANIGTLEPAQKSKKVAFQTKELNLWYGEDHALKNINLDIFENEVTAIIGPSGCGKSTFIKTLNRMVELIPVVKISGDILYREKVF